MSIGKSLRTSAKQLLIARQHKIYEKMLSRTKKDYNEWIRYKESKIQLENAGNLSAGFISFAECGEELYRKLYHMPEDIIVFCQNERQRSELAKTLVINYMQIHPDISLAYGDEDQIDKMGKRVNPWFKPDWSPDLFLAEFYFGSVFAVRRLEALEVLKKMQENGEISSSVEGNLYGLCYRMALACGGFEKRKQGEIDTFPIGHIPEVLFHNRLSMPSIWKGSFPEAYGDYDGQLISVVIPSKDHPEILERCLLSFVKHTEHKSYQFIVVDNGSTDDNRTKAEELLKRLNQENENTSHLYLYSKMPFNFSKMCNIGSRAAAKEAELLLFLNDDMEIRQEGWLEKLAGKAILPRVGAVGAKLLYPGSDIIQHAGITNLRVGPAHKLQFLSDGEDYYFGKNRGVHNMAAVTGACLMVRKAVFEEVGGFPEELAVAFNDVDLCYSIWEAGYVNVVLNDVILYHHESLSRGKDGESEEKRIRLLKENDTLYRRHQNIYAKDPFYHKYLLSDMLIPEYVPAFHYEVDLGMPWAAIIPDGGEAAGCPVDACVRVGVECTADIFKWKYGITMEEAKADPVSEDDKGYYLQGYSFVIGGDNACYERVLLMKNLDQGQIWQIPIETNYRPDIKKELSDQLNVDLTGFSAKMRGDAVPPGTYLFGMMVKDRCSRQKLVNWSERELTIEG